ncbi:helix-hairpin-helix domain-containing protein [Nocardia sp. NPDC049149]|uniref:helix-hairpin-helix domain-containing protein n=1 Tax=Nocardia sp. NPDC049149 TaxID=3364315 RepID=UPI00371F9E06
MRSAPAQWQNGPRRLGTARWKAAVPDAPWRAGKRPTSVAGPSEEVRTSDGGGTDQHSDAVDAPQHRVGSVQSGSWDLAELPELDIDDEVGPVSSPEWLDEPAVSGWRDRLVPERFRGIRFDPGRRGVRTLLVVGVVATVVAGVVVFRERPVALPVPPLAAVPTTTTPAAAKLSSALPSAAAAPGATPQPHAAAPPATELVISVVGLVQHTGLVRLPAGSRVADALTAAGGPQPGADLTGLNMAQPLIDGDQVLVGPPGQTPGPPRLGSTTINATGRPTTHPSGPATPPGRVNLNAATESELDALPGVGPITAKAIITWRTSHGRFTDITQLGQVDGIGPARLARLRDLVQI